MNVCTPNIKQISSRTQTRRMNESKMHCGLIIKYQGYIDTKLITHERARVHTPLYLCALAQRQLLLQLNNKKNFDAYNYVYVAQHILQYILAYIYDAQNIVWVAYHERNERARSMPAAFYYQIRAI